MQTRDRDFDAIVVGSGISGGWATKELTERGLKVLLIERGRDVVHGRDYVGEHQPPWQFPFRGVGDRHAYDKERPIQRTNYACTEGSDHFFVKDSENPYQQDPERPFNWIRGYHLGGRSLTWGRVVPRWGEVNFAENARDGLAVDWPIRYRDIQKWYDYVEDFAGVSGQTEVHYEAAPYGKYLPPIPMNCLEEHVALVLKERLPHIGIMSQPTTVLSREHRGRPACHFCGPCHRGCSTGSYFSSLSSTLPAAEATGNLTKVTDTIVAGLDYDPKTRRVVGIRTIDRNTRARHTYRSRIVFLNASTLGTTQVLLLSKSEMFPNGLANSSGVLGHYLMDHFTGPATLGTYDLFDDRMPIGNRPIGVYVPRFRNLKGKETNFYRGYGFQGGASRQSWTRGMSMPGFGKEFKQALRKPGPWTMLLSGFGECLPYYDNRVELDEKRVDQWGIPQLRIHFQWGENERKMATDMVEQGEAIHRAAGAIHVARFNQLVPGGATIHEMGTARMGCDPGTSVLNGFNQAHDVANLFVTDGACMTSSAAQNPSITYMALTARAADYAVTLLKSGEL
jgi:choline dehydrogenase-like flavoprotein